MEKIIKSNGFKIAAVVIGIFLIAILSFAAGVRVGFRKARFSYQWGANYERNFAGPGRGMMGLGNFPGGMMRGFGGGDFRNAHGVSGVIASIGDNQVVVKDRDGKENTVAVTDKTIIKLRRDDLKFSDLKMDDRVVVLGNPDDTGVIKADIIRVFDPNF